MQSVSAHGGLVHVVVCAGSVSGDDITALIKCSPNLMTCHIYVSKIRNTGIIQLTITSFTSVLKQWKFSDRKLFTHGSFELCKLKDTLLRNIDNTLVERNMDIVSLWSTMHC